jgi:hypothetical protein
MLSDTSEDFTQVGFGIHAVELGGTDQTIEGGRTLAPASEPAKR